MRPRRCLLVALLCTASVAGADPADDLARAKNEMQAIKRVVVPGEVNRLDFERRFAIWANYYGLLEHLWRMQVHHEMMTRHGWDRRAEFDAASANFTASLESLRGLLPADG